MARTSEWEKEVRQGLRRLAKWVNEADWHALVEQTVAHEKNPTNVPLLDLDDPAWPKSLVPAAKRFHEIGQAIRRAIYAEEAGDKDALHEALQPIVEYMKGWKVEPQLTISGDSIRLWMEVEDKEEERPLHASTMVLEFAHYLDKYNRDFHLGVCRQCGKVYLKPKFGGKSLYCSKACTQKAYRERKQEKEGG